MVSESSALLRDGGANGGNAAAGRGGGGGGGGGEEDGDGTQKKINTGRLLLYSVLVVALAGISAISRAATSSLTSLSSPSHKLCWVTEPFVSVDDVIVTSTEREELSRPWAVPDNSLPPKCIGDLRGA